MKKNVLRIIAAISMMLLGTQAFAAKNDKSSVTTKVSSIDIHGNLNLAIKTKQLGAKGFSIADVVNVKVGNFKFTAPIVKNYSDVPNGEYLVRINGDEVSLAINYGNLYKTSGAEEDMPVTITMKDRFGYLTAYHVRLLTKSSDRSEVSSDEAFANFRAVKAGKIAENRLYRSSNPIIKDVRAPYSAKLTEENKISTVLNLMNSEEQAAELLSNNAYYAGLAKNGNVKFVSMGVAFDDESFINNLHDVLVFLSEHEGPYLIHGKEGKHRTGYVAALLEALNGATIEEMKADFIASFENYYAIKPDSTQYREIVKTIDYMFAKMNNGKPVTNANVQAVAENYLLKTVKLTPDQIAKIKANLQQ